MKSSRLIVTGLLGLVLAVGLFGCKITGASPDPSVPVVMNLGDTVTFKVTGPPTPGPWQRITSPSLRYAWYNDGVGYNKEGNTFSYTAKLGTNNGLDPLKNRMTVTCKLEKGYYINCCQSGLGWNWSEIDRRQWDVHIYQSSSTWQGNYIITDSSDMQDMKRYSAINGDLIIRCKGISNLLGIPYGFFVSGSVYIQDSPDLESLQGMENLTFAGNISIARNALLKNLSGLEDITTISGYLSIWDNDALTSLSGLENVTLVGGGLWIDGNAALSVLGLSGLLKVGGDFSIYYNPLL